VSPSCADNTGAHPDLAFGFTLAEDSDVILTATPTGGQALSLQLLPLGGGFCGAELFCVAAGPAEAAVMSIINLGAGAYAIMVDGNGAATQQGGFTLGFRASATSLLDGALVINEVHDDVGSPLLDANAEFLEIANPSAVFAVSTAGLTLVEEDGTPFTQSLTASGVGGEQLIIAPGGFLLGVPSADPALNGGVGRHFDLNFGLNQTPVETIQIFKGSLLIDAVNLPGVGSPSNNDGISFQLDVGLTGALLNDAPAAWCLTPSSVYSTNNRGTPGGPNESCSPPACTVGTQAVDCNDNQPCTDDVCIGGTCQNVNDNTNTPAADAFSCTVESCLNGVPSTSFNDAACDDAVGCTLDACLGTGGQVGTGCQFLPDNGACNANEFCDPVNDCQP
jgi:hypothetical protein